MKTHQKNTVILQAIFPASIIALSCVILLGCGNPAEKSIEKTARRAFELLQNNQIDKLGDKILTNGRSADEARDGWRIRLSIRHAKRAQNEGVNIQTINEYLRHKQSEMNSDQLANLAELDAKFPHMEPGLTLEKLIEKEVQEDIHRDFRDSAERGYLVELYDEGQKLGINWADAKFDYVDTSEWESVSDIDDPIAQKYAKGCEQGTIHIYFSENGARYKIEMSGSSHPKWEARLLPSRVAFGTDGPNWIERVR